MKKCVLFVAKQIYNTVLSYLHVHQHLLSVIVKSWSTFVLPLCNVQCNLYNVPQSYLYIYIYMQICMYNVFAMFFALSYDTL